MVLQLSKTEEVEKITRQSLRKYFPLYQEDHKVEIAPTKHEEGIWIGYRIKDWEVFEGIEHTHFDVNILGNLCYLLSISLDKEQRGKGLGYNLYQSVIETAKRLGCERVRTMPSGGFFTDGVIIESRRTYLSKRNWKPAPQNQLDYIIS